MKLCMIGTGYVGLVSGVCFSDLGNTVYCVDKNKDKIKKKNHENIIEIREIIKSYNLIPSDIAELQKLKGHDEIFAEKLKESKSIIAVLGSNVPSHSNYDRKAKAKFLSKGGDPKKFTYSYPYSIGSLEKLEKNVKGLGSISFLDQLDGIIRSLPCLLYTSPSPRDQRGSRMPACA